MPCSSRLPAQVSSSSAVIHIPNTRFVIVESGTSLKFWEQQTGCERAQLHCRREGWENPSNSRVLPGSFNSSYLQAHPAALHSHHPQAAGVWGRRASEPPEIHPEFGVASCKGTLPEIPQTVVRGIQLCPELSTGGRGCCSPVEAIVSSRLPRGN